MFFGEIPLAVSKFPEPEKKLIQKAQTICKLPTVKPEPALLVSVHSHLHGV